MKNLYIKRAIFFSISFLLLTSNARSQTFIKYWDKTYGGNNDETANKIIYNGNNELILLANSKSNLSGDKTDSLCNPGVVSGPNDLWILRIDTSLNILWQRDVGGDGNDREADMLFLNNNLLVSCETTSEISCEKSDSGRGGSDYWLINMDTSGAVIWDKTFGGSLHDYEAKWIQLTDKNYILCGVSQSPVGFEKSVPNYGISDYWIIKIDTLGNKIWDNVYGGILNEYPIYSLMSCPNSSFILAGTTLSPLSGTISDTSRGGNDFWLIKIDSSGAKIWDKRYGGSGPDQCYKINSTADNGFVLCGTTESPQDGDVSDTSRGSTDFWIIKTDSLGNKQWDKRYGGNGSDGAKWVEQDVDGGYLIAGNSTSGSGLDVSEPRYSLNAGDYWIIKTDSMGNKLWDKRFGGPQGNYLENFAIMPDSSIILFGSSFYGTSPVKSDTGKGATDYWLVRFKYSDNTTGIQENATENNLVSIYPNPAKNIIYISTKNNFKPNEISLYDAEGRKVLKKEISGAASFSIKALHAGIYFYEIKDTKGNAGRGKVVRE